MSLKKIRPKDKKYTAVIIGAGRIAAGFDDPQTTDVLTHAHAYQKNPQIQLVGWFDAVPEMAKKAARKWGGLAFDNLEEMLDMVRPDIVSICTPDTSHYDLLQRVKNYAPRVIICEKPIVFSPQDLISLKKDRHFKTIPVLVNYSRRFDLTVQKVRAELKKGTYGKVIGGRGVYTKGILHNGSHLIDLARFLLGEITSVKPLGRKFDYSKTDPTVSAFLSFDYCPEFFIETGDERHYSIFEIEIRCEKARLLFSDFGFTFTIDKVTADKRYKGYRQLGQTRTGKTELGKALSELMRHSVDYLETGAPLVSDLENALQTQAVCFVLAQPIIN